MCKRIRLDYFLTSCKYANKQTKNLKWIKNLNVRPETTKLLEENISGTLSDINHSKIIYDSPRKLLFQLLQLLKNWPRSQGSMSLHGPALFFFLTASVLFYYIYMCVCVCDFYPTYTHTCTPTTIYMYTYISKLEGNT